MEDQRIYPKIQPLRYKLLQIVIRFLVGTLTRFHAEGMENIPLEGPVIVYLNHLSFIDSPTVFITIPRPIHHLAAEKYEHHWLYGWLLRTGGAIFIQRGEVDRVSLRKAGAVLDDGHLLVLAIEGTRSPTRSLQEGKTGVAYFATRTGAALVPTAVWGTENVFTQLKRFKRPEIHIRFGEAFRLPEGRARSEDLEQYTDDLMVRLAQMLPESYRGVYREHPRIVSFVSQSEGSQP
jgi:1-acyl-sn-glycerol-3-phosphate acyltransferase